jgi:molybdenum cofactor biosynthesis protein B
VGHHHHGEASGPAVLALLTVSDTRDEQTDRSGATMRTRLEAAGHRVFDRRIVPDEPDTVREVALGWLAADGCDGVLVSGGTGISARDRTYEALCNLLDKRLDGFGELFRALSYEEIGSAAMLSRAAGGVARGKLLFLLPGSTAAVRLALDKLILPEIGHLLGELSKHRTDRSA